MSKDPNSKKDKKDDKTKPAKTPKEKKQDKKEKKRKKDHPNTLVKYPPRFASKLFSGRSPLIYNNF